MQKLSGVNMQIPKAAHLKVATFVTLICGAWPLILNKKSVSFRCYKIYAWLLFIAALYYLICNIIEIVLILLYRFNLKVLTNNVTSVTVYALGLYRIISLKNKKVESMILEIWSKERQILNSEDKEIIDIYNENVRKNVNLNYFYWISQMFDSVVYLSIIFPIFSPRVEYFNPATNKTILEKPLPLEPWFPFDKHEYHLSAYLWEEIGCYVCLSFHYGTDVLLYSFMSYILGQINILKHFFKKFELYSKKIKRQLNCDEDKADLVTMKLCISEHQQIIKYINNFNDAMRNIMLFDFLQSSTQIAMLAIFLTKETFLLARIIAGAYAIIMLLRLAVYYWYANEIMTNCWTIGDSLYGIDWYKKSKQLKSLMVIYIMRCNKQTGLEIGSLTIMTWNIFFGIVKGAYSFITFVLKG